MVRKEQQAERPRSTVRTYTAPAASAGAFGRSARVLERKAGQTGYGVYHCCCQNQRNTKSYVFPERPSHVLVQRATLLYAGLGLGSAHPLGSSARCQDQLPAAFRKRGERSLQTPGIKRHHAPKIANKQTAKLKPQIPTPDNGFALRSKFPLRKTDFSFNRLLLESR